MKSQIAQQLFAGKFEIQGEIAKGQTGTILYGYDIGLRQEVAIKIYHSHINGRLIQGKAFIKKSKPLLLIDHPNLIKIFKVEEEENVPVIFMEFFDAPSLQQIIHDHRRLSVPDMLMLAKEITEVLVHTHFQGIIHGTLHPGHVLVGPQGQVKVTDLGLSWILMDILPNCEPELLRPLPYFPPEIAKGELLNMSSDLYCLGFMMYEMLTGKVPYAGLPKTSIMGKLAFDQTDPVFDFPRGVPEIICKLIRDMTRNEAQQRIQDATHVLTIINQQLAKHTEDEESPRVPTKPTQPQTSTSTSTEPKKEALPPPTQVNEPTLRTPPPIRRPQSPVDYRRDEKEQKLRRIGITLGLILFLSIAGILGYWYRDLLEPYIPLLKTPTENLPQKRDLPESVPNTNEPSSPMTQDSLNEQNPEQIIEDLSQEETPLLTPKESTELSAPSDPISPSPKADVSPTLPVKQEPKAKKLKQESPLTPTQKKPVAKKPSIPSKKASSEMASEIAPVSSKKVTTQKPIQKPIAPQPAIKKSSPEPTVAPKQKEPVNNQSIAPIQQPLTPPLKKNSRTPSALTPIPKQQKPVSKQSMGPVQQPLTPPLKKNNRIPSAPTPIPKQKQPVAKQPIVPIEKPNPQLPSTEPSIAPRPNTNPTKEEILKSPASFEPTKKTVNPKNESSTSTLPSEDKTLSPTDEEIEEIIQSLGAAKEDLSSILEP